ncbi:hypothetical protein COCNU_scaffold016490G000050 [Cocos nucifera]|nr:hypothetical protein [Cocos nucifera]
MPPRGASIQRSAASVARSRPDPSAPASAPATQVPPITAVDAGQFNLLIQQVSGLTEMMQAMSQPPAVTLPKNPPSGCRKSGPRKSTRTSVPVAPEKEKQRAEDSCSNHRSPLEETFPICSQKPSKTCNQNDALDHKIREMDRRIEELSHVAPAHLDDVRTDPPFSLRIMQEPVPPNFELPQFESYNGTSDPVNHLEAFRTMILLHGAPDAILC